MVSIESYDDDWPGQATQVCAEVRSALGERCLAIAHVGSTSVPGLSAKPVIDVAVGVHIDDLASAMVDSSLAEPGFQRLPVRSRAPRVAYARRGLAVAANLHAVERDGQVWRHLLAFRDFLVANPDVAHDYVNLKHKLAASFASNPSAYSGAKRPFFAGIQQQLADFAHARDPTAPALTAMEDMAYGPLSWENPPPAPGPGPGPLPTHTAVGPPSSSLKYPGTGAPGTPEFPRYSIGCQTTREPDNTLLYTPTAGYSLVQLCVDDGGAYDVYGVR